MAKMLFDSRFRQPYIVWKKEFKIRTVNRGWWYQENFSFKHNLPYTPLIVGQWSLTADFAVSYDLAVNAPEFDEGLRPKFSLSVSADGATISGSATSDGLNREQDFYVRLMALERPDYIGTATETFARDDLVFNSNFNYLKILKVGVARVGESVGHGLGFLPQVKIWHYLKDGENETITPFAGSIDGESQSVRVNARTVDFGGNRESPPQYFYIIFDDEV